MEQSVAGLNIAEEELAILVDGNRLPEAFDPSRSEAIIKGDSKCLSIAAASIIAKVTRDRYVVNELHVQYPEYNFAQHKGYGVKAHCEAIRKHGPCPAHRRTFEPCKSLFPLPEQEAAADEKEAKPTKGKKNAAK